MGLRWHNLAPMLYLGICWPWPAWAGDIYVYTSEDGQIHLTNVPSGNNYKILVAEPQHTPEAVTATPKPKRNTRAADSSGNLQYKQIIEESARANGLDSALIHAVISVESRYNAKAVSAKGAVGLMQLMPKVASQYGVTDLFDPAQNIRGGARYLRDLLGLFNGDLSLALAAYNAGEAAVFRYGNRIPPFRETSKYVPRVLNFYRKYQANPLYSGVTVAVH